MKSITFVLIKTINYLIKNELWARKLLQNHIGKTAHIETSIAEIQFLVGSDGYFFPKNNTAIGQTNNQPADVILQITPQAYTAWLQHGKKGLQKQVKISGDAEFASTLAKILDQIRWEPEESLAQIIGDVPAHQLNKVGKKIMKTSSHIGNTLFRSIADYMFDEKPQLAPQLVRSPLFDHFKTKVAELRDDVSRAEKRVRLLEQTLTSKLKK